MPKQMFINCTNLKYVHMEGAVVDEEKDITAASRAKSITSGNLSNLKIVGSGAFYGCTAMRYMAYPKLATSIGKAAYKYWGSTRDELDGGNVKVSQTIHPEQKGNDVFYNGQNVGKDSAQLNNYYSDGIAAVDINVVVNRPKDYLFIVDTTGSMHTKVKNYQSKNVEKFEVTREALLKIIPIIKNENPNNRISIIAFSIADGTTRSSEVIPFDFEENETNDKRWADTTSIVQNKLQIGSGVKGFTNFTNGPTAQDETGGTDYATGCLGGLYEIMEKAKYEVCTMFMSDGYANTRLANIGSYGAILRCMSENVYSVGVQLVKGEKTVDDDNTPDPDDDTSEDVSISVGKVNKTYNDVFIEYVKKDTNKPEIYLQQVSGKANYFNFVSGDDMQDKINKCMVDFAHTSSKLFDKATIKYKIKNEVWAFYRDNSHQ
ncbi:MAG: VWA domain-containing protein [Clostridia bacterium]|nr:VWA domain-containing protein [Clostridia bacterium]